MAKNDLNNNPRFAAARLLIEWDKERAAISKKVDKFCLSFQSRDAAFVRRLTYGVLENIRYLDFVLDKFLSRPTTSQKAPVRNILRLALYELIFLDTPVHAAINENVNLAKKLCPYAKNFINAILRKYDRKKELISEDMFSYPEDLSIRYSVPYWIFEYLSEEFSTEDLKKILELNNQDSPLSIFIAKEERESLAGLLKEEGIDTYNSHISDRALLAKSGPISESKLFKEGRISIQSQASIKVAQIMTGSFENKRGKILDLCAAPGSKSVAMKLMAPGFEVIANDIEKEKLKYIRENSKRLSAPIEVTNLDGRILHKEWLEEFDAVLVDAPCSGLGLIGRKADIRWNRKKEDIYELNKIQKELIKQAQLYVKPGGRLVYSTCTYGRLENEDIIAGLDKNIWHPEPIGGEKFSDGPNLGKAGEEGDEGANILKYSPLDEGADGFFMASFIRAL